MGCGVSVECCRPGVRRIHLVFKQLPNDRACLMTEVTTHHRAE